MALTRIDLALYLANHLTSVQSALGAQRTCLSAADAQAKLVPVTRSDDHNIHFRDSERSKLHNRVRVTDATVELL
jgi:hypothetical protein